MCEPVTILAITGAVLGSVSAYQSYDQMKEAKHEGRKADAQRAEDKAALDKERREINRQSTAGTAKALAAQKAARSGYGRRSTLLTGSTTNPNAGAKTLLGQ